ncbi:UNVERIFIED_CONTAM: hypothetical protein K2H54_070320 [Gekko kuhli]
MASVLGKKQNLESHVCCFLYSLFFQQSLMFGENDEEQEALLSLDKPGWYSQGNASHLYEFLKKMTGKLEPKVVYFGDSMHSDIFSAHHYSNWETVLILEELKGDTFLAPSETEAEPLGKKGKYERSGQTELDEQGILLILQPWHFLTYTFISQIVCGSQLTLYIACIALPAVMLTVVSLN